MKYLIITFLLFIGAGNAFAEEKQNLITVMGRGEVFAVPDKASITMGVSVMDPDPAQAMALVSERMTKIFEAIEATGIPRKDMQTVEFSIYPRWNNENRNGEGNEPKIIGYMANNSINVQVRDIAKLPEVLKVATSGEVTNIGSIEFGLNEMAQYTEEARRAAVRDAKLKADQLAEEAGVGAIEVVALSEVSARRPMMLARAEGVMADMAAAPVAEGMMSISVDINASYAFGKASN